MKTSELEGAALDWAVAKAANNLHPQGEVRLIDGGIITITSGWWRRYSPSTDWTVGGPIIEMERIDIAYLLINRLWVAVADTTDEKFEQYGSTFLIAAMRCYVCRRLGEIVDVPEELT